MSEEVRAKMGSAFDGSIEATQRLVNEARMRLETRRSRRTHER